MTTYIAAYDVENDRCLAAMRKIVVVHEKHEMPATLFIVARLLEKQRDEYVALLKGHPLFEIACHSYTHMMLTDVPPIGKAGPAERLPREIGESKRVIEDAFACAVQGFRPPVGMKDGMVNEPDLLRRFAAAGYRYLSSHIWGPDWSMPALLTAPYTYAAQGFADLWELPACGWHENLLKRAYQGRSLRLVLYPSPMPEAVPLRLLESPEEEFAVNCKPFLDKARADAMTHVSLVWHPWSLDAFDPDMRMIDRTFACVRDLGLPVGTFAGLRETLAARGGG